MNSLHSKIFIPVFLLTIFFAFGEKADAAVLFTKPSHIEVSVGNIVNVQIFVDTAGKVINNAESIIQFPKDLLEVVSLDNRASIFPLWVEQPSFSNSIGQATFNGGVPNPGFNGGNGTIISIIFRAKKAGTASILFSNSAVRENDGLGTDIFSGQRGATVSIVTKEVAPVVLPPAHKEYRNIPEVSIIKSKTHPDQEKWYSDNTPEFSWDLPEGTLEVRTLIGKNSAATPSVSYIPPISKKKVDELPDGTYYFTVQVRTAGGWSVVSRYRVNIDTTPPQPFSITFPHGTKSFEPQSVIFFNTTDSGSGISHYDIKIGSGGPGRVAPIALSNPYLLPPQRPGIHTVAVTAVDRADNTTSVSADFTIEGIEAPIITYYQDEIESGDIIKIRGTTYPDSDVSIFIKQEDEVISEEVSRSNSSGDFSLIVTKNLDPGIYAFTARVTDGRGAKSDETKPLMIAVNSKFLTDITNIVLDYLSATILVMLALGGIVGVGVWIWYRLSRAVRRLRREAREAEQMLDKAFDILRKDISRHITRLKKAQSKRKLTLEEIAFLERFDEELAEAQNAIAKEVQDISRS